MSERVGKSARPNKALLEKVAMLKQRVAELNEAIEKRLDPTEIERLAQEHQTFLARQRDEAILDDLPVDIPATILDNRIRQAMNLFQIEIYHTAPPELPESQYDRPIGPRPNPDLNPRGQTAYPLEPKK